jgi:hypothetical protein
MKPEDKLERLKAEVMHGIEQILSGKYRTSSIEGLDALLQKIRERALREIEGSRLKS